MNRQCEFAERIMEQLRKALGRQCAHCGTKDDLQFDCVNPQGHASHHAKGKCHRALYYRKQYEAGNLQLLCEDCHVLKSLAESIQ